MRHILLHTKPDKMENENFVNVTTTIHPESNLTSFYTISACINIVTVVIDKVVKVRSSQIGVQREIRVDCIA